MPQPVKLFRRSYTPKRPDAVSSYSGPCFPLWRACRRETHSIEIPFPRPHAGYTDERFKKDLLAGLIVGIVALPLAMAFAIASGVAPGFTSGIAVIIFTGQINNFFWSDRIATRPTRFE
jgi:hypothetical protein